MFKELQLYYMDFYCLLFMAQWDVLKLIGIKICLCALMLSEWTHPCQKRFYHQKFKEAWSRFLSSFFYFILYIALVMISKGQLLFQGQSSTNTQNTELIICLHLFKTPVKALF